MKEILKTADYELTLQQLKNQRVQLSINLEVVQAGIDMLEKKVPKVKDGNEKEVEITNTIGPS